MYDAYSCMLEILGNLIVLQLREEVINQLHDFINFGALAEFQFEEVLEFLGAWAARGKLINVTSYNIPDEFA